jgi:DNA-binding transcriptional LysR family regulator
MRRLEKRLGLQLFARTTQKRIADRSPSTALLNELKPALERIERSLAEVKKLRQRPAGRSHR